YPVDPVPRHVRHQVIPRELPGERGTKPAAGVGSPHLVGLELGQRNRPGLLDGRVVELHPRGRLAVRADDRAGHHDRLVVPGRRAARRPLLPPPRRAWRPPRARPCRRPSPPPRAAPPASARRPSPTCSRIGPPVRARPQTRAASRRPWPGCIPPVAAGTPPPR